MSDWPRWLTVETAARYLDRTPTALRSLVQRGAIPCHKVQGRVLFGREELDQWVLSGGRVSPRIMQQVEVR